MRLTTERSVLPVALAAFVSTSGCFRAPRRDVTTHQAEPSSAALSKARLPMSSLDIGARLTVVLDEPVSSSSKLGRSVRAHVEDDVHAADGTLVIRSGAPVAGRIAAVRAGRAPLLALDFVSVQTTNGPASISAMLSGAERVSVLDTGDTYEPRSSTYDAFFSAWYLPGPAGYSAPTAGTYGADYYDEEERTIRLPSGARLGLELTQPLRSDESGIAPVELEPHGDTRRSIEGPLHPWGTPPIFRDAPANGAGDTDAGADEDGGR